jgi:hypothetical protein
MECPSGTAGSRIGRLQFHLEIRQRSVGRVLTDQKHIRHKDGLPSRLSKSAGQMEQGVGGVCENVSFTHTTHGDH